MANTNLNELPFELGARTSLVFYRDSMPIVVEAEVVNLKPFQLATTNPSAGRLARMRRALVVRQDQAQIWRLEAEVKDAVADNDRWICTLEPMKWAEIDRRRHPRFAVKLPVSIRAVIESDGQFQHTDVPGTALDLSLCGARVMIDAAIEPGALVEISIELSNRQSMQALAVTAFTKPYQGQLGFEFIDFVGNAQYMLHSFLVDQAA
ncbi:MAG: PilZ domain-containing protein [Fimbriimonadaceae bacterium]